VGFSGSVLVVAFLVDAGFVGFGFAGAGLDGAGLADAGLDGLSSSCHCALEFKGRARQAARATQAAK
jgi:hypothetical protein